MRSGGRWTERDEETGGNRPLQTTHGTVHFGFRPSSAPSPHAVPSGHQGWLKPSWTIPFVRWRLRAAKVNGMGCERKWQRETVRKTDGTWRKESYWHVLSVLTSYLPVSSSHSLPFSTPTRRRREWGEERAERFPSRRGRREVNGMRTEREVKDVGKNRAWACRPFHHFPFLSPHERLIPHIFHHFMSRSVRWGERNQYSTLYPYYVVPYRLVSNNLLFID